MVETLEETLGNAITLAVRTNDDDDVTIVAEKPVKNNDFIESEMTDLTIRYEIPFKQGKESSNDFQLHVKLLIAITTSFDHATARIYDNKNNRVKSFTEVKWMDKDYYSEHFTLHVEKQQRKTVIAHRIMSTKSVTALKNESSINQHLRTSTTFMRGHFWKEDQVSLRDIGFLTNYVPTKHSKAFVIKDLYDRCGKCDTLEWDDAPAFQLIDAQPKVKLQGHNSPLKTHAFSVQVLAQDATKMNNFLRTVYADENLYVPYSMKKKYPQAVAKAILQQNRIIHNTWVVAIVGINREIMPALEDSLRLPGVLGISDTNRTDKTGRWHVLVEEKQFKTIRKTYDKELSKWILCLPDGLLSTIPSDFPEPAVHQKHAYSSDDEDSNSGLASYMSSCAQSYGSFGDTDEADVQYFQPPGQSHASSYADVLTGRSSSPPRGPSLPTTVDVQAYTSEIADLKAEITIAKLRAEVQTLKGLMQAQTPSTVTEASTPHGPSDPLADRMLSIEANMATLNVDLTKWMAEVRQLIQLAASASANSVVLQIPPSSKRSGQHPPIQSQASPSSHHSKCADMRRTPERGDPMLTQPNDYDGRVLFQDIPHPHPGSPHRPRRTTRGYDPHEPEQLYADNGDGSLYPVGYAGPNDYHRYGVRRGMHHSDSQNSTPIQGPPITRRAASLTVTGSPRSLPAEGARPED